MSRTTIVVVIVIIILLITAARCTDTFTDVPANNEQVNNEQVNLPYKPVNITVSTILAQDEINYLNTRKRPQPPRRPNPNEINLKKINTDNIENYGKIISKNIDCFNIRNNNIKTSSVEANSLDTNYITSGKINSDILNSNTLNSNNINSGMINSDKLNSIDIKATRLLSAKRIDSDYIGVNNLTVENISFKNSNYKMGGNKDKLYIVYDDNRNKKYPVVMIDSTNNVNDIKLCKNNDCTDFVSINNLLPITPTPQDSTIRNIRNPVVPTQDGTIRNPSINYTITDSNQRTNEYKYIGCYKDDMNDRNMNRILFNDSNTDNIFKNKDIQECVNIASDKNANIFGMQSVDNNGTGQCWIGNYNDRNGVTNLDYYRKRTTYTPVDNCENIAGFNLGKTDTNAIYEKKQ